MDNLWNAMESYADMQADKFISNKSLDKAEKKPPTKQKNH